MTRPKSYTSSQLDKYVTTLNDIMNQGYGSRKMDWEDAEEDLTEYRVAAERDRPPSDYKRMLMGVMKHLRETGADTLEVLRDNELNDWWGKEVAKMEAAERKAAAKERAMSVLTAEERRALGLKF